MAGLVSRSEILKVAVGFSPRIGSAKGFVAERRLKPHEVYSILQASLRDATRSGRYRGLKPTATIMESLRDVIAEMEMRDSASCG